MCLSSPTTGGGFQAQFSKGIFEIRHEGYVIGWMTEGEGRGLIIFKPFSGAYVEILYEADNYKSATPSFDELRNYAASESVRIYWRRN